MMPEEEEDERVKERAREISIREGSAYSLMDGFGLKYITPYALALGATNAHIGVLSALPGLVGNLSQIRGARLIEKYPRKKIVFMSILLQTLMWLPLIGVGALYFLEVISSEIAALLLIAIYTTLILFGAFAGPAWSSWMRDLITKDTSSYFGRRNRIVGAIALVSMLIAGAILDWFGRSSFGGFLIIFLVAFLGRAISTYYFTRQYEPQFTPTKDYYFTFGQFVRKMLHNNFGRFVLFAALISFATAVASPFFAVYMLQDLHFSYFKYTIVVMASVISTLLFMPVWGKIADKYGTVFVLRMTGSFIFTVPLLWLAVPQILNSNPGILLPVILCIEVFSGFIWAGFNLATATFVFHAVTKERLAICVAYNGILNSLGAFVGASLGGILSSLSFPIFGMEPILFVFVLSGGLRLIAVLAMIPSVHEVDHSTEENVNHLKQFFIMLPKQMQQHFGVRRLGFH